MNQPMPSTLPLIDRPLDDVVALVEGQKITVAAFLADVAACAEQLPPARYLLPLTGDRYRFLVLFAAALCRGATTLLPARRDQAARRDLAMEFAGLVAVGDASEAAECVIPIAPGGAGLASQVPQLPTDLTAALAFTSGSTGTSERHEKSWGLLALSARQHWTQLPTGWQRPATLVCTVPPWHMYGFEWSVLACLPGTGDRLLRSRLLPVRCASGAAGYRGCGGAGFDTAASQSVGAKRRSG